MQIKAAGAVHAKIKPLFFIMVTSRAFTHRPHARAWSHPPRAWGAWTRRAGHYQPASASRAAAIIALRGAGAMTAHECAAHCCPQPELAFAARTTVEDLERPLGARHLDN